MLLVISFSVLAFFSESSNAWTLEQEEMVAKEMSLANKSLVEFEMEMAEWSEAVMEAAWPCEDQEISEWGEEFCSKCDQCHHCDKCKWCE